MPPARPFPAPTYLDLLHPDGAVNRAAFEAILRSRIAAEIDLRLCLAAGKFAPARIPLGEARAWRKSQAKHVDPALVPPDERARIAGQEHAALTAWRCNVGPWRSAPRWWPRAVRCCRPQSEQPERAAYARIRGRARHRSRAASRSRA